MSQNQSISISPRHSQCMHMDVSVAWEWFSVISAMIKLLTFAAVITKPADFYFAGLESDLYLIYIFILPCFSLLCERTFTQSHDIICIIFQDLSKGFFFCCCFFCLPPNMSVWTRLWWVERDWSIQYRQPSALVQINVFTWIIAEEMSTPAKRKRPCLTDAIFQSSRVYSVCVCVSGLCDFTVCLRLSVQRDKNTKTTSAHAYSCLSECELLSLCFLLFGLINPLKFSLSDSRRFFSASFPSYLIISAYWDPYFRSAFILCCQPRLGWWRRNLIFIDCFHEISCSSRFEVKVALCKDKPTTELAATWAPPPRHIDNEHIHHS